MSRKEWGIGVIGLGFMGQTHLTAYRRAREAGAACRLVAVSDHHEERRSGRRGRVGNLPPEGADEELFDPEEVNTYEEAEPLIEDPEVDAISICTPTDSHVEIAIRALKAGKHVLVEKPVSLDPDEIHALAEVAREAGRVCMPAMCMRFWPGWRWLRDRIEDSTWGSVRSARFSRLVGVPSWSREFYLDRARSGGAIVDLHVHDVDFIHWCFGAPERVESFGKPDHIESMYIYDQGPTFVSAEGGWVDVDGFEFQLEYRVVFERAVAEFRASAEEPLRLLFEGSWSRVPLPDLGGYDAEVRHFLDCLDGGASPDATLEEAAQVAETIRRERAAVE